MYGLANNITGIKIVGTNETGTTITDLNKNLKYVDGIDYSTINTRYRNFYRNLSENTFESVIVEQATNVTETETKPNIISPEYILIPTSTSTVLHNITIEVDTPLYGVTNWYFENLNSSQLTLQAETGNYPKVAKNNDLYNQITFKLRSNNFTPISLTAIPRFCFYVITRKMNSFLMRIEIRTE